MNAKLIELLQACVDLLDWENHHELRLACKSALVDAKEPTPAQAFTGAKETPTAISLLRQVFYGHRIEGLSQELNDQIVALLETDRAAINEKFGMKP